MMKMQELSKTLRLHRKSKTYLRKYNSEEQISLSQKWMIFSNKCNWLESRNQRITKIKVVDKMK